MIFTKSVLVSAAALLAAGGALGADLAFDAEGSAGAYRFDTGLLTGVLRAEGASIGLMPVVVSASGTDLSASPGLFNYYRVFAGEKRFMPDLRSRVSTAKRLDDGSLEVTWPAAEGHPYTMTATYTWRAPGTLDLATTVTAHAGLPDFEVFLSSYLTEPFPVTSVYVAEPKGFATAEEASGTWQMYPRDDVGAALVRDGRWAVDPNAVDWQQPGRLAAPLAFRRDPASGVTVAVMAPAGDCFAVSTPCRDEPHRSMYLSLFGRDLEPGETATAHARLLVGVDLTEEALVEAYAAYAREH